MSQHSTPRIAIIGGGPGGLTAARILHLNGIEAQVFERDASGGARSQGGSLDMHADSGMYALKQAGLADMFKQIARYEDQESRVYDKHGTLLFLDDDVEGKDRPEIDRGQLRQLLLDSLPDGMVCWGEHLQSIEQGDGGSWDLVFAGEHRRTFDLVVGADGAWSRVRSLLSQERPVYSGIYYVDLGISDADRRFPELARLIGRGLTFILGDCKALIGHRDANAHLGIYAALRAPENWVESGGLDTSSPETIRRSLAAHYDGWSSTLLDLILHSDDGLTHRGIYALPVGHRWEHRDGLTLLGDAAHVMSPFGGDGANLAMQDGADLALKVLAAPDWRASVRDYEETMFTRAEPCAAAAAGAVEEVFSEDGLQHTLGWMQYRNSEHEGSYEMSAEHGYHS